MKTLFKTTAETPRTSTWLIIAPLITGASDFIFKLSELLGWKENIVAIIGLSLTFVSYVVNVMINNNQLQTLDVYAKALIDRLKEMVK